MKVGIITFHNADNYGALLQSYALSNYIISCGYDATVINYNANSICTDYEKVFKPIKSYKDIIKNALYFPNYKCIKSKRNKFKDFLENKISTTSRIYNSLSELQANPPKVDYMICGSDQIWRPLADVDIDFSFYLDFGNYEKRISYAPSFGKSTLDKKYYKEVRRCLNEFNNISIREDEGKEIIKEITKKECEVVLDPTFLLSKSTWKALSLEYKIDEKYVLVFCLEKNDLVNRIIKKVKEETSYKVVILSGHGYKINKYDDVSIYDAGIEEFIGLVDKAKFVITNSFHGTAFSIILNKPFINIKHSSSHSRITSLFNKLGIENRMINEEVFSKDMLTLDYTEINKNLEREVGKSKLYLKNALESEN